MIANTPEPIVDVLREISEVGGEGTYLVGGFVRDLLLDRPSLDIDIVVEGDAIQVAEAMCDRWRGTLEVHPQFGTAVVTSENMHLPKVDFVTARRETYHGSGTLPIVRRGTITEDLQRRDFSINALAIRLDKKAFGTLVDKVGGVADLKAGLIRVLHGRSFLDDPTRIFRAGRYAGRYGFRIAEKDSTLIQGALPILRQLSGKRIRSEIERVLLEENVPQIAEQLTQFGVWKAISTAWNVSTTFKHDFKRGERAITWATAHLADEPFRAQRVRWMTLFGADTPTYQIEALSFRLVLKHQLHRLVSLAQALQHGISLENVTRDTFEKLGIPLSEDTSVEHYNGKRCIVDRKNRNTYVCGEGNLYRVKTPFTAYSEVRQVLESVTEETKPSEIFRLLKPYPIEAVLLNNYIGARLPGWKRQRIENYLLVLRRMRPLITGRDLVKFGKKPGKAFESELARLFASQLDGEITKKEEAYLRLKKEDR